MHKGLGVCLRWHDLPFWPRLPPCGMKVGRIQAEVEFAGHRKKAKHEQCISAEQIVPGR